MTDSTYISIQLLIIILLSFVDGVSALTVHPEWFQ